MASLLFNPHLEGGWMVHSVPKNIVMSNKRNRNVYNASNWMSYRISGPKNRVTVLKFLLIIEPLIN